MRNRLNIYGKLSHKLANYTDSQFAEFLDSLQNQKHYGIGGGYATNAEIDGEKVFVKTINVCPIESIPANKNSTKNLFALPPEYQYGVGSAGFGVWRELQGHLLANSWVLEEQCPNFPLLYHWRVLPRQNFECVVEELVDVEESVSYWGGNAGVRDRLNQIIGATHILVLVMESFPYELAVWCDQKLSGDSNTFRRSMTMVESAIKRITNFMEQQEVVHYDAHFQNFMTDGDELYLTDFGLFSASRFELGVEEREFLAQHVDYDRALMVAQLVLFANKASDRKLETDLLDRLKKYEKIAHTMKDFYNQLRVNKLTPFPAKLIASLCRESELF